MSVSGFDTELPGNPDSVNTAGEWLEDLRGALRSADVEVGQARHFATLIWQGEAADNYQTYSMRLREAIDEIADRTDSASDRFLAYAQQLQWTQEDLASQLERCRATGLEVDGHMVLAPAPAIRTDDSVEAEYREQVRLNLFYANAQRSVSDLKNDLSEWITTYLVPEYGSALEPSLISAFAAEVADSTAGHFVDRVASLPADTFAQRAIDLQERAVAAASTGSGNDAVNAGRVPPSEDSVNRHLERRGGPIEVPLAARVLAEGGGIIVDGALIGYDLATGASPTSTLVEFGTGTAATAGIVAVTGAGGPILIVVGLAGGLVGNFFANAWEDQVPQHDRERWDRDFRENAPGSGPYTFDPNAAERYND